MTVVDNNDLKQKLADKPSTAIERAPGGKPATIADLINNQRAEIARALPKHMDADRLARIATTVIKTTPKLMECTADSLLGALMLSAQTGLEPGPLGHVYFVPRRNSKKGVQECQWLLGYKGIIDLARRSGKLTSIEAREVCEKDHFEYEYGLNEKLEHKPSMGADRGAIVAFWGLARFKDGGHYFLVMSKADVDAARARSETGKSDSGPWTTDYAAMGRKTVIRRMQPYLPLQAEQAMAIAQDESVHTKVSADMASAPVTAWAEAVDQAAIEAMAQDAPVPPAPVPPPVEDQAAVDTARKAVMAQATKAFPLPDLRGKAQSGARDLLRHAITFCELSERKSSTAMTAVELRRVETRLREVESGAITVVADEGRKVVVVTKGQQDPIEVPFDTLMEENA